MKMGPKPYKEPKSEKYPEHSKKHEMKETKKQEMREHKSMTRDTKPKKK